MLVLQSPWPPSACHWGAAWAAQSTWRDRLLGTAWQCNKSLPSSRAGPWSLGVALSCSDDFWVYGWILHHASGRYSFLWAMVTAALQGGCTLIVLSLPAAVTTIKACRDSCARDWGGKQFCGRSVYTGV